MIIVCGEVGAGIVEREAVGEDIMRCLDVERLFDLGVGGCKEVEKDGSWDEERDEGVLWSGVLAYGLASRNE